MDTRAFSERFPELATHMSAGEIGHLLEKTEQLQLPAGDTLLASAQPSDSLFLVAQGRLSVTLSVADRKLSLSDVNPGQWVGEISMIDPGPASATVQVEQDSVLLRLSHQDFKALGSQDPSAAANLLRELTKVMASRVRATSTGLLQLESDGAFHMEHSEPHEKSPLVRLLAGLFGAEGDA